MRGKLSHFTKLICICVLLALNGCANTGRYTSLNKTMNECGFKKVRYADFHGCMNEKISPPTNDGTDYYSKTNGQIRAQLDMYAEQIKKKKLKEKDAYADFTTFVSMKAIEEQKSAQVAGTIVAVALVGVAVGACAHNNCLDGWGDSGNSYAGNCPCPYSIDAAGNQCGARSAWSRSGGASPQCY